MIGKKLNNIFLVLGAVWVIFGLFIYNDFSALPLGFVFLLIGFIGKLRKERFCQRG